MLRAELRAKLTRAEAGRLKFGRGEGADVDILACTGDVLELRFRAQLDAETGKRLHLRLYFTEPEEQPGCLLHLFPHAKHDYPAGKDEQTTAATVAQQRYDEHGRYRSRHG